MVSLFKALYYSRAFFLFSRYTSPMQLTLDLPDELFAALAPSGQDLSRAALEAIALQAYRERKLTSAQLQHLLGFASRYELDAFLKQHQVWFDCTEKDPEHKHEAHGNWETGHPHTPLIQQNGLLVHLGKAPQDFDWDRILDEQREERTREISGL